MAFRQSPAQLCCFWLKFNVDQPAYFIDNFIKAYPIDRLIVLANLFCPSFPFARPSFTPRNDLVASVH